MDTDPITTNVDAVESHQQSVKRNPNISIDVLPDEILEHVFLIDESMRSSRIYYALWPLLLCNVNHHWRDVAMSCPLLWSDIYLTSDIPLNVKHTEYRLARSATSLASMNVVIHVHDKRCQAFGPTLLRVLDRIHRWRSFIFEAQIAQDFDEIIPSLFFAYAPRLRHIEN